MALNLSEGLGGWLRSEKDMAKPAWLKTISNHAVIGKGELLEWLGVTAAQLKVMLRDDGFPPPRFGGFNSKPTSERVTSTSRWRVGDVRAWLEGSARLRKELATEIGADRAEWRKRMEAARIAAGFDEYGRPAKN